MSVWTDRQGKKTKNKDRESSPAQAPSSNRDPEMELPSQDACPEQIGRKKEPSGECVC